MSRARALKDIPKPQDPNMLTLWETGKRLKYHPLATLFVEEFGAKGTGLVDDAPAIQKCLDHVEDNYDAAEGESIQIVLTGHYKCNSGLRIPNRVDLVSKSHCAGNDSHNTALLNFRDIGASGKAITLGQDSLLRGLDITGNVVSPISGAYGIYGGLSYLEGYGIHNTILECSIAGFETGTVLSGWLNTMEKCYIGDAQYGVRLQHAANQILLRNNVIKTGSNPGRIGVYCAFGVDRGGEGIWILENAIEQLYLGIVVEAGEGIVIAHNRFEVCNAGFIEVRGLGTASDEEIDVDIHHNWMTDYGGNASGSSRFGIKVSAGRVTIDDNNINRYDAALNIGLTYGITFGGTGTLYNCLIGRNQIQAYSPFPDFAIATTLRQKIQSRFYRQIEYMWDLAESPADNVEHFFRFIAPIGYSAKYSFRSFCAFNIDAIKDAVGSNVEIGEISIGYREATPDLAAYLDNFELTDSNAFTVTYATDAKWTAAAQTIFGILDGRVYLIRFEPGAAVSGRILATLVIDEFQY